ncbi:MAG: GAF domain-containing protein [Candidatus Latescibacteria bacterium]|nr:GAF domain-containing protein [Candidatus Latescibacterota bacterium]NIO00998.1 GAF domain-containing protein [Candidatus Latescibacterota bacterium]NIO27397.1 GAF domain-containing protein [Candidatus Latescibacterota bacterium]NIO54919.1 GAF domain-containing protein [Candidatus Latescibacterota bacterium]NIT01008.1 GAF domain-containing protein [Candidatus Latescibacterota bacterium]
MDDKSNKKQGERKRRKPGPLDHFAEIGGELKKWRDSAGAQEDSKGRIVTPGGANSTFQDLLHISASINSTLNLQELLRKIVDSVIRVTDCDRGFLMLRNEKGDLTFAIARSKDEKDLDEKCFEISQTIARETADTGEPVVVDSVQNHETYRDQESIVDLEIKAAYGLPLKFEDRLVGVIYVDSNRISQRLTDTDLSIIRSFGAQAAVAIENAKKHGELEHSVQDLKKQLAGQFDFSGIIGRSKALQEVIDTIKRIAPVSSNVLIQGESGTGKELVARAIHHNSHRKDKVFYPINCAAIPESLLESALFGHLKGSFTGADADRKGAFETANGGTIFLDEVAEIPRSVQAKLLRVLQDGEIQRIGSDATINVDVRIIAATNKNLMKEVREGKFRDDVYYRLNVVPIRMPPLRERPADIILLSEHFLERYSKLNDKKRPILTSEAKKRLLNYNWPGNVRVLENLMERIVALHEEGKIIDAPEVEKLLGIEGAGKAVLEKSSLKEILDAYESQFIRKTLMTNSWNVTKAAQVLGISRQVLHNKIRKYNLSAEG